jgi:hypothetical protein
MANNSREITALEPDYMLTSLLKREMAKETDSLLLSPTVNIINTEARSFLLTDTSMYSLAILPTVGSFHGTSGLNAIQSQYNLTMQAFNEIWNKLGRDGIICITCWMDYPVRNPIKIIATLIELLERKNVFNPADYIAAIRSWSTITFIVKKRPLDKIEILKIRDFCQEMLFDPLLLPDINKAEQQQYNKLTDKSLFENINKIISPAKDKFYHDYPFRIKPATDNRPYFSQYLRWGSISQLSKYFGERSIPFMELGYIIVILTLIQVIILAALLIILPLLLQRRNAKFSRKNFLYFGSIGLAYMFVEIVMIQQFILYFGHPIYSVAAVISTLLLASGAGSYYSQNITRKQNRNWIYIAAISAILLIYSIILTPTLQATTSLPITLKITILLLLVGIPGFLMGIPFPTGITLISQTNTTQIPQAWATNGYFSVISTTLAIIISVEAGFTFVLLAASLLYSVCAFVSFRMVKN